MNLDLNSKGSYIEFTSRLQNLVDNPEIKRTEKQIRLVQFDEDKSNVFAAIKDYQRKRQPINASLSPYRRQKINANKNHSEYIGMAHILRNKLWRKRKQTEEGNDQQEQTLSTILKGIPKAMTSRFVSRHKSQKDLTIIPSSISKQHLKDRKLIDELISPRLREGRVHSMRLLQKMPSSIGQNLAHSPNGKLDIGILMDRNKSFKLMSRPNINPLRNKLLMMKSKLQ